MSKQPEKYTQSPIVDHSKRQTLKRLSGIGAGSFAFASTSSALAGFIDSSSRASNATDASIIEESADDLSDIEVRTAVSPVTNDIEVVIKNTGQNRTTITDMTPAEIHTARGTFDFDALLKDGDLIIESGEYVSVPLQHHKVSLTKTAKVDLTGGNLRDKLARTVSITTGGDSLAVVSIVS